MKQEKAYKIKLITILEILKNDSDENHYISTPELIAKLAKMGIECERQTLYRDIAVLNDFGYEVLCEKQIGLPNKYCVINKDFEVSELKILIDAVQSSSFITPKKTKEFVDKLARLGGSQRKELLGKDTVKYNTVKHSNEQIYYLIEDLEEAILENKQVSFQYFDLNAKNEKVFRKNGERYIVNPYSMVIDDNNYYLVVYSEKYEQMIHYRLDRMFNMIVEEKERIFPDWVETFDLTSHKKQVFGMYVGETKKVTIDFDEKILNPIIDKFGEDEKYISLGDGMVRLKENVQISPQFISWVCSFGKQMKVVSPEDVVLQVRAHIEELRLLYEGK